MPHFIFALLFLVLGTAVARAQDLPAPSASFVADQVITVGDEQISSRVYGHGSKQRVESEIAGAPQISIVLPEEQLFYMVMPGMNSYISMEMTDHFQGGTPEMNIAGREARAAGEEEIAGETVTRYELSSSEGPPSVAWVTPDGILVRFESTSEAGEMLLLERSGLVRQEVDPALFTPPQGYREIKMNPEVMQEMMQQGGAAQ